MARKLMVQLCWMWGRGLDYGQLQRFGPHMGSPKIAVV